MPDFNFLIATRLNQDQQNALRILEGVCRQAGLNLYLTGASMRDLLTNQPVRLLNITTEGDPLALKEALLAAGAERLSARTEPAGLFFSLLGCRMRVEGARGGAILEDLRGRGLALNSIGLSLNPGSRGLPLDPCNGAADIEARLVRSNHAYVFLEDPVALLRAVRLATRLEFGLEERTRARMEAAREGNYLARATPESRGQEWEAIAYEPDPALVLRALEKDGWLEPAFGAGVRTSKMNLAALGKLTAALESWELLGRAVDTGAVATPFLMAGLPAGDQNRLGQWMPSRHLGAGWKKLVAEAQSLEKKLLAAGGGGSAWLRAVYEMLGKFSPEAVVYAALSPSNAKSARKLRDFHAQALQQRQRLPLSLLRGLGVPPRSQRAEALLRPWYLRLLGGEGLSDAELAEGVRRAVVAQQPAAATTIAPAAAPAAARRRRGGAGAAAAAKPAAGAALAAGPRSQPAPRTAPTRKRR
ncbi:MAG: hypothetical protein ACTHJX_14085 [Terriglobales bacterium]